MILVDVNVLLYAHRRSYPDHSRYRRWLEEEIGSDRAYGMADLILSSFIRIVTHPSIFPSPSTLAEAMSFVEDVRDRPNRVSVAPADRHWEIFTELCRASKVTGNLVPDAYLAALAIESGCEWVTTDRDYARFSGLRWRHPLK
ncbi:MAG: type II toxin-antitoxin system VapC family toxin [Gemmatimonadota bacterium]